MAINDETFIGPISTSDGRGTGRLRQDKLSAMVVSDSHGRYYEQSSRGVIFCLSTANTGTTIVAANVSPPAAAAATAITLLNPVGSLVNLEILRVTMSQLTGTPGTGAWTYCVAPSGTSVTAAQNTPAAACFTATSPNAKGYVQTALTGGPVHTVLGNIPASVFAGALAASANFTDVPDGMIVVAPGWMLTLAPPATGTTLAVAISIFYAEVTIPS